MKLKWQELLQSDRLANRIVRCGHIPCPAVRHPGHWGPFAIHSVLSSLPPCIWADEVACPLHIDRKGNRTFGENSSHRIQEPRCTNARYKRFVRRVDAYAHVTLMLRKRVLSKTTRAPQRPCMIGSSPVLVGKASADRLDQPAIMFLDRLQHRNHDPVGFDQLGWIDP